MSVQSRSFTARLSGNRKRTQRSIWENHQSVRGATCLAFNSTSSAVRNPTYEATREASRPASKKKRKHQQMKQLHERQPSRRHRADSTSVSICYINVATQALSAPAKICQRAGIDYYHCTRIETCEFQLESGGACIRRRTYLRWRSQIHGRSSSEMTTRRQSSRTRSSWIPLIFIQSVEM